MSLLNTMPEMLRVTFLSRFRNASVNMMTAGRPLTACCLANLKAYLALSRVKSLNPRSLSGLGPEFKACDSRIPLFSSLIHQRTKRAEANLMWEM